MSGKKTRSVTSADASGLNSYNSRALIRCEGAYLGAALPTKTTQPPGIIHEPLERICEKESLPTFINQPKKPVRLYVFHSGIIIELLFGKLSGELVWYPIQNLYCSAGIQPLKTKHGSIEFHTLEDKAGCKSTLKPLFCVVLREAVKKKVLQCHAFAVAHKELAQLLVQATAFAYRDKNGWNQPLNALIFNNNECNYTLNIVDEIHTDSGYSDHEESSQKSTPQPSELSVEQNVDNPKHNEARTSSPSTTTLATSRETITPSPSNQSPVLNHISYLKSRKKSTNETQHSADDMESCHSTKASSISSGYPLSRDSSAIVPIRVSQQIHPFVVNHHPQDSEPVYQYRNGSTSPVSLPALDALSLEKKAADAKEKNEGKLRRSKTTATGKPTNVLTVKKSKNHSPSYQSYQNNGIIGQYYQEPVYVSYHPEQFMYEGEKYIPHVVRPPSASTKKSRKASSTAAGKDQPKVQVTPKMDTNTHLSMERRLTKKTIPRQLL